MAQLPPNHPISPATQTAGTVTPNDPPKPKFTPRKEFIQERRVLSSFCILTLSVPGLVRLYSFPQPVIDALRRLFDQHNLILGIRHDIPKLCYEFALEGKPWANPKNIKTEKLLVDILHEVFLGGYHLLSSLDYGREQDDRIAIAFSKPTHVPTPLATPQSNGSAISLHQCTNTPFALSFLSATTVRVVGAPLRSTPAILQAVRVAWPRGVLYERKVGDATYEFKFKGYKWYQEDNFATDSLHLTLGLLKTLDHHGFSLLTSLSLASRSRVKDLWIFSGVHPGDNFPDTSMTDPTASSVDLKKEITPQTHATNVLSPSPLSQSETDNCHPRKLPNPPGHNPENNRFPPHARSASDSAVPSLHKSFHFSKGYTALLRRTPRKQTHVSDAHDLEYPLDQSLFPNVSPDKSPSVGSVDLTGIGLRTMDRGNCTPDAMRNTEFRPVIFCPQPERTMFPLLSQSSPYPVFQNSGRDRRASNDSRPTLYPQDTSRHRPHSSEGRHFRSSSLLGHPGYSPRVSSAHPQSVHAPPPLSRTVSGQDVRPVPPTDGLRSQKEMGNTPPEEYEFKLPEFGRSSTPPLNSAVRDSAFSSGIRQSFNIPITWTGKSPEPLDHKLLNGFMEKEGDHWSQPPFHPSRPEHDRVSIGPLPPGGWTSTPRDERGDISTMFPPTIREQPSLEREDRGSPRNTEDVTLGVHMGTVPSRSPERIDPDLHGVRKSEAASIGVLPNGKSPKNRPNSKEKGKEKQKPVRRDTVTSGWVMVNVESHGKSKESNGAETASGDKKSRTSSGKKPAGLERPEHARSVSDSRVLTQSTSPQSGVAPSSMSAAAKAIVMIDAQGSKEHQEKSGAKSGLRKLLDRGKAAVTANDSTSPGENSRATLQRKTPETSGMNGNASKSTTLKEPRRNKAATITKTKVKRRVT